MGQFSDPVVVFSNQIKYQTFHRISKLPFISKISRAYIVYFSTMLKSMSFSLTVPSHTSNMGKDFLYSHLSFTAAYSLKSKKDWPVDFAKLRIRASDSVYSHVS